jgi:tetratricopeptide (TPR) repeat protein
VRASKRGADVATFVLAALQLRETADARRMLRDIDAKILDPATALALVDALVGSGEVADAQRVLAPLLEAFADDPDLQLRASVLAEQQGRLRDAATHVERVLELASADGIELQHMRELYARLLDLESRVVQAVGDDAGLDRALAVAARWRAEDPDNDDIDVRTAQLLFASDQPAEASRHLASITERHPALGDAHAKVAETLEREAMFERADAAWNRAFEVEPTNPTWLLRRAQNRMAYADPDDALPFLEQIAKGEWQPRFMGVVSQAAALR